MTTIRSDINQGPSKFELMLALFDRTVVGTRHVEFNISNGTRSTIAGVVITGVEIDDGSGESWIFKGYTKNPGKIRNCLGWYRTDTRRGWIELLD